MVVAAVAGTVGRGRPKNHSLRKGYIVSVGQDLVEVSHVFHDRDARQDIVSGFKMSPRGKASGYVCFPQKMVEKNYQKDKNAALSELKEIKKQSKKENEEK